MVVRTLTLSFMVVVIFSFNNVPGNNSNIVHNKSGSPAEKESAVKKDLPVSIKTGVQKKWTADAAAAQIKFSVKGPFGTVHGSLSGLKSTILFDGDDLAASSIKASVDPRTISTGIKLRNKDLQKEKYLNSEHYPSLGFQSNKIQKNGNGYKAIGGLTIKGVTKEIEIPFSFSQKGNAGIFKGSCSIQRSDYGVGGAGGSIGSTISIDLEVPVTR